MEDFGRKKLGLGKEDKREKQKRLQNTAEKEAMVLLLRHASDINLRGKKKPGPGPGPGPTPDPPPQPLMPSAHKEIGFIIQTQFPDAKKKPRIDWGEVMLLYLRCFNKTSDGVKGLVSLKILQADTLIEELLANEPIELKQATGEDLNPYYVVLNNGNPIAISVDENRYTNPGEYRIKADLINANDGNELDSRTVKFWVAENPPKRMPFKLEPSPLSTKHAWQPGGDIDNDPTIYYNTNHPQYKLSQENEENQSDYLFNICLEGALHFVLTRPPNASGKVDYRPLNTNEIVNSEKDLIPEKVYKEISEYISKVRWRRFEE